MKLLKDEKYPEMYRVEWDDGTVSDMVNKTRAKDAMRVEGERQRQIQSGRVYAGRIKAVDAFKSSDGTNTAEKV